MTARVYEFSTFRGCGVTFLAYLVNTEGEPLEDVDLDSIVLDVRRQNDSELVVDGEALDPSEVMVELGADIRWTPGQLAATPGRNFVHRVSGSAFSVQDFYRVEYTFVLVGGEKAKLIFEGPARSSEG